MAEVIVVGRRDEPNMKFASLQEVRLGVEPVLHKNGAEGIGWIEVGGLDRKKNRGGGRRAFNVLSGLFDERADDLRWHDGCKIAELAGGDAGDLPVQSE